MILHMWSSKTTKTPLHIHLWDVFLPHIEENRMVFLLSLIPILENNIGSCFSHKICFLLYSRIVQKEKNNKCYNNNIISFGIPQHCNWGYRIWEYINLWLKLEGVFFEEIWINLSFEYNFLMRKNRNEIKIFKIKELEYFLLRNFEYFPGINDIWLIVIWVNKYNN